MDDGDAGGEGLPSQGLVEIDERILVGEHLESHGGRSRHRCPFFNACFLVVLDVLGYRCPKSVKDFDGADACPATELIDDWKIISNVADHDAIRPRGVFEEVVANRFAFAPASSTQSPEVSLNAGIDEIDIFC